MLALSLMLGVPLLLAGLVAFTRPRSQLDWLLSAFLCGGVSVYMVLAGANWTWIGFGWQAVPLVTAAAVTLWSARRIRACRPLPPPRPLPLAQAAFRCAVAALIAGMLVHLHLARIAPPGAVDLSFPLEGGRYAVMHGGTATVLNYHRAVPAQTHATDIVALSDQGRRAQGLRPRTLDAYEIFDRAVIAPCDGIVSGMSDGAPDAPIGRVDPARPAGNHVLLSCVVGGAEVTLLLAHLRRGSVVVTHGDRVRRGARLGQVGNSGNSTEPHLHIHAVRGRWASLTAVLATAEAVPLTFDGRFLIRNAVVSIPDRP